MATIIQNITDEEIEMLRTEASRVGDDRQVTICNTALDTDDAGYDLAREMCAKVLGMPAPVTEEEIEDLMNLSANAGDRDLVQTCVAALHGGTIARTYCAMMIANANAMVKHDPRPFNDQAFENLRKTPIVAPPAPSDALKRGTEIHQELERLDQLERIQKLKREALHANDFEMAEICNSAIDGEPDSIAECERVISGAKAMDDRVDIDIPESIDQEVESERSNHVHRIVLIPTDENSDADKPRIATTYVYGNGSPERLWHNRWLDLGKLPVGIADTSEVVDTLREHIDELLQLSDGYESKWDGSNQVGYWRLDETADAIREAIDQAIEDSPISWTADDAFGQTSKLDLFGEDFDGSAEAIAARASDLIDELNNEIRVDAEDLEKLLAETWKDWNPDEDDIRLVASESVEAFGDDPADYADADESYWREACREDQQMKDWPDAIWPIYRDEVIKTLGKIVAGK